MTMSNDDELRTLQQDVQRLLGRCMFRLQQYERLIKAMLAEHKLSGPMDALEQARSAQFDRTATKTLGTVVGELLGSYVVAGENSSNDEAKTNSPENVNWFAMQIKLVLPAAEFVQVESELRELVRLRNNLVHHFTDQNDIWSSDGCRGAQEKLISAYTLIDRHFGQLKQWADTMVKARQAMSEVLQSEAIIDFFDNGNSPDGKVNWEASDIVSALREAFYALAVDGWASVTEAGSWVAKRYPEQLPAKYGCGSWRQVVHETPVLEIRRLERDGHLTPCYREKVSVEKSS
ncbi:OST-HTH/LOTUS domain-containing protein [Octadecabacter temperatus]|uniref:OST-HTH/LOTUS domain protein n=1 Tax=Octadecabacter temperatus TaxID=1458307 RepID=A0A0K0Y7U0_9RHOB|nr:OST-HTH/LOTUS domain-containing protein [Octadecabacter temperatus]AKS47033.1 OST-HTH/LOTUS domain protein [Octadecabacter temperatus]SIO25540.1 OST-HTH/LOTUS domain-containing protein [Octadecabacter temperatus]